LNLERGRILRLYSSSEGILLCDVENTEGMIYYGLPIVGLYVETGMSVYILDGKLAFIPLTVPDKAGADVGGTITLGQGRSAVSISDSGITLNSGDFVYSVYSWLDDMFKLVARKISIQTEAFSFDTTYKDDGKQTVTWWAGSTDRERAISEVYDWFFIAADDAIRIIKCQQTENKNDEEANRKRWSRQSYTYWFPTEIDIHVIDDTIHSYSRILMEPDYMLLKTSNGTGDFTIVERTKGDSYEEFNSKGAVVKRIAKDGNYTIYATGDIVIEAEGKVIIKGAEIHLNP